MAAFARPSLCLGLAARTPKSDAVAAEPHILIVDDDAEICFLVRQFLEPHGFRVTAASDGKSMRAALAKEPADLVILDLMLPGDDGLTLCRELRATARIPIIFLTALNSEADRVVGLEMGADDYLSKPFSTRELLARVARFCAARPRLRTRLLKNYEALRRGAACGFPAGRSIPVAVNSPLPTACSSS